MISYKRIIKMFPVAYR